MSKVKERIHTGGRNGGRPKGSKDTKPRSRRTNIQIQTDNDTFDIDDFGENYYQLRNKMYTSAQSLKLLGYADSRRHEMMMKAKAGHEPEKLFFLEIARCEESLRGKYISQFMKASKSSPIGMNNVIEKLFPEIPRKVNQLAVDFKVLEEMREIIPEVIRMLDNSLIGKKVPPRFRELCQESFVELFNEAIKDREVMLGLEK